MVDENPNIRYTVDHEWARREGDGTVTIGITHYAQEALGDIVFVELPEVGDSLEKGAVLGVVESVKTTSDVYMPVSGEIIAVNEGLEGNPAIVNEAPFGEGWLIRVQPQDAGEHEGLMTAEAYTQHLAQEDHH